MSDGPEPWASDDNVSSRQPAFCPYCGYEGAFDGLSFAPFNTPTAGGEEKYRHHCPDCGYEFITIREVEDGPLFVEDDA